jgi:hypothetical protein
MHTREKPYKSLIPNLTKICRVDGMLITNLVTFADYQLAFQKATQAADKLGLGVAASIEFGVAGFKLLLEGYVADMKDRQANGEERLDAIVFDAYGWACLAEKLYQTDPHVKDEIAHQYPDLNFMEAIGNLKNDIIRFSPDLNERWFQQATKYADLLCKKTLSKMSEKQPSANHLSNS